MNACGKISNPTGGEIRLFPAFTRQLAGQRHTTTIEDTPGPEAPPDGAHPACRPRRHPHSHRNRRFIPSTRLDRVVSAWHRHDLDPALPLTPNEPDRLRPGPDQSGRSVAKSPFDFPDSRTRSATRLDFQSATEVVKQPIDGDVLLG